MKKIKMLMVGLIAASVLGFGHANAVVLDGGTTKTPNFFFWWSK